MNLNQITISVSNVEKSISFYTDLGLIPIVKSLPHYARFQCPEGDATFSLHLGGVNKFSNTWIYFELQNLDEKVEELIRNGFVFEELPNDKSWLWREARLKDPDQNQIILYFAGENRLNPPWKLV